MRLTRFKETWIAFIHIVFEEQRLITNKIGPSFASRTVNILYIILITKIRSLEGEKFPKKREIFQKKEKCSRDLWGIQFVHKKRTTT